MIKFKIDTDNLKRLLNLGNQAKDLTATTKPIFFIEKDKLVVRLYSLKNCMEYSSNIQVLEEDPDGNYFTMSLVDFDTTLEKVSLSCTCPLNISIEKDENKVTFENAENGTKISLVIMNEQVSEEEVATATTMIQDSLDNYFTDAKEVKITQELISFMDTAQKFMNITLRTNSIAVNKNTAKYFDYSIIMQKTLAEEITGNEDVYIRKALTDFLKPFVKVGEGITVKISAAAPKFSHAYIDAADFGFKAILSYDAPSFEFPEENDILLYRPKNNLVKVEVKKDELAKVFSMFNGTFKNSNWEWKPISIATPMDKLNSGILSCHHHDNTASCDTELSVVVLENTENSDNLNFNISSSGISDIMSIINSDTFTMEFNNNSAEHIWIESEKDNIKVLSVKVEE
jgi:hypothetical protein